MGLVNDVWFGGGLSKLRREAVLELEVGEPVPRENATLMGYLLLTTTPMSVAFSRSTGSPASNSKTAFLCAG
jgi:hypothetical protein